MTRLWGGGGAASFHWLCQCVAGFPSIAAAAGSIASALSETGRPVLSRHIQTIRANNVKFRHRREGLSVDLRERFELDEAHFAGEQGELRQRRSPAAARSHWNAIATGGLLPSVTVTFTGNEPATIGVPVINPLVAPMASPVGKPAAA